MSRGMWANTDTSKSKCNLLYQMQWATPLSGSLRGMVDFGGGVGNLMIYAISYNFTM